MYYTIYKITNKINGKIYIGAHKTKDINDKYMGSGTYLINAQNKYGIENFEKVILEIFDSSEEMYSKENEIVNEDFLKRDDVYNLKLGGQGGYDYLNSPEGLKKRESTFPHRVFDVKIASDLGKKQKEWLFDNDEEWVEKYKMKMSYGMKTYYKNGGKNGFKGKNHSEETKKKLRCSHKGKHEGAKNSQFGTMWIYNLEEKLNKKINKDDFSKYEKLGWLKGRKMKF